MGRPNQRRQRNTPRLLNLQERQTRAIELRASGQTYAQIAAVLGYATPYGAQKAVEAAIRRERRPAVRVYQEIVDRRLDMILRAYWYRALGTQLDGQDGVSGDIDAAELLLKNEMARMRLLGLLAPTKVAPTDPDGEKPFIPPELFRAMASRAEDIERRLERLRREEEGGPRAR